MLTEVTKRKVLPVWETIDLNVSTPIIGYTSEGRYTLVYKGYHVYVDELLKYLPKQYEKDSI